MENNAEIKYVVANFNGEDLTIDSGTVDNNKFTPHIKYSRGYTYSIWLEPTTFEECVKYLKKHLQSKIKYYQAELEELENATEEDYA